MESKSIIAEAASKVQKQADDEQFALEQSMAEAANEKCRLALEALKAAIQLWGDSPLPTNNDLASNLSSIPRLESALAHANLSMDECGMNALVSRDKANHITHAAECALTHLGHPSEVEAYLRNEECVEHDLHAGGGYPNHFDPPRLASRHPATKETWARRRAESDAREREAWLRGEGEMTSRRAEELGVTEEYERRLAIYARRLAVAEVRRAFGIRAKGIALEVVVDALGDDVLKAGWTAKAIRTEDVIELLWQAVFADGGWKHNSTDYSDCDIFMRDEKIVDIDKVSANAYRDFTDAGLALRSKLDSGAMRDLGADVAKHIRVDAHLAAIESDVTVDELLFPDPARAETADYQVDWQFERVTAKDLRLERDAKGHLLSRSERTATTLLCTVILAGVITLEARRVLAS